MIVSKIRNFAPLAATLLLLASLSACGDSRPEAAAAAHVYNSSEQTVSVSITAPGSNGATFSLAPGAGQWVPLRRADVYTAGAPELGYSQTFSVSAGSTQEVLFDIGAAGRFTLEPIVYVPQDMSDSEAEAAVENILNSGDYDSHTLSRPAAMHILPTGVFYSFGDDPSDYSERITTSTYEVRYQLLPM